MSDGPFAAFKAAMKKLDADAPTIECPTCGGDVPVMEGFAPALGRCRQCHHHITMLVVDVDSNPDTIGERLGAVIAAIRLRLQQG